MSVNPPTAAATTGEIDGAFDYRYAGLGNPVLSVGVDQLWDADGPLIGQRSSGVLDTLWVRERERGASAIPRDHAITAVCGGARPSI